jgi:hypothetical protein
LGLAGIGTFYLFKDESKSQDYAFASRFLI